MLGGHRAQNMLPCCAPNPFSFPTALLCCVCMCGEEEDHDYYYSFPCFSSSRAVCLCTGTHHLRSESSSRLQGIVRVGSMEKIKTRDVPYASSDSRLLLRFCLELCDWENSPSRALTPIAVSRQTHTHTNTQMMQYGFIRAGTVRL